MGGNEDSRCTGTNGVGGRGKSVRGELGNAMMSNSIKQLLLKLVADLGSMAGARLRRRLVFRSYAIALFLFAPAVVIATEPPAPVGRKIADFTLPNTMTGKDWSLAAATRESKATVFVFLATGCPASSAYGPKLNEIHSVFGDQGVTVAAVFSHPTDERADVATFAKAARFTFPVLHDADRALAKKLAVERVPTAILLDASRTVRYAGRIDDQYAPGVQRAKATTKELINAIKELLAEKEVTVKHAPAAGCLLPKDKTAVTTANDSITYHQNIVGILQEKCQSCHRPGEVGPFSLTSYKQAKGWAEMIREVVSDGTMPPWHADAPYGHFSNDRRLSEPDKKTLLAWIDQGCPEGDPKTAPAPKSFVSGWRLEREPDLVIKMNKTISVPASYLGGLAGMPYQYVPAGKPFDEDKWVEAIEVRPDFRQAIHHIIAFVIPPGKRPEEALRDSSFGRHMLASYVPGDQPIIFPPGTAKKLPKGSWLLFEVHYTPNGVAGKDCSSIGLIFAKEPPKHKAESLDITNNKFAIPPGDANHEVRSRYTFPNDVTLLALTPHMHVRGKAFRFELITKDDAGKDVREVLLNVPQYDFNWQSTYIPAESRKIKAGSRVECTAWFDNSAANPFNPDPKKRVRWGNQTWEEMMIGFVEYVETKP
jgi:peroxiredoxin